MPRSRSVATLASAAASCTACPLHRDAIQTVFGKGPSRAPILLVGEQPGDVEDKKGLPFVGPAGAVLWSCLEDAGIDRDAVFATNAVKHFKHELRGKRRLHKKPNVDEIEACHPWLDAEVDAVRPRVIVALGAVAARSLCSGAQSPIEASRGTPSGTRRHPGPRHLPPVGGAAGRGARRRHPRRAGRRSRRGARRRRRRRLNERQLGTALTVARPVWSGTITFGLVNVPVKAHSAVRDHDVHFHQLEKGTGSRIRYQKVAEKSGKEVDPDEIELGFEVRRGRYVTFDRDELAELRPESTRAVELSDFVGLSEIDPIYYERTYWLSPANDTAKKPYQLLLAAMEKT